MKVLHLNTDDIKGGAAIAVQRIHKSLINNNIESSILVKSKNGRDNLVTSTSYSLLEKAISVYYNQLEKKHINNYKLKNGSVFSLCYYSNDITKDIERINPDVVHLHWIGRGFIKIELLKKIKKPIVWTLHDAWPFTGGCHYFEDCTKYLSGCIKCPMLGSSKNNDLSSKIFKRKLNTYNHLNGISIVAPSHWISECAKNSRLLNTKNIDVIHNGLDIDVFRPIEKNMARQFLGIPPEKKMILFGAINANSDERKGMNLLVPVFREFEGVKDTELMIFGIADSNFINQYNIKMYNLGEICDESYLSIIYSAADVMLVPSRQEAFGQTALESLSCGTPVVAFNATGLKDIIKHQENGYLAQPYKVEDFAHGIKWILSEKDRWIKLSSNARKTAVNYFDSKIIGKKYLNLYQKIVGNYQVH